MNIYTIISKEATKKYADTYVAYNYYEKSVARLEENARKGYKVLCEYFNGSTTKTGLCVVSEDRAIEVLGLNDYDGKRVLAMMYELKLTERQNGMVVI